MRFLAFEISPPTVHATDVPIRASLPSGLRYDRFVKNPVVFFGHAGDELGTVRDLSISATGELSGTIRFVNESRRDRLLPKLREGVVKFAELAVDDDGSILELSIVGPFSANAELLEEHEDADTHPHVLRDGERLIAGSACDCRSAPCACRRLDSSTPEQKDPPMHSDSTDSPRLAHARLAKTERDKTGGMRPLTMSTQAAPARAARRVEPARRFDGGNEKAVIKQLRELVTKAADGELNARGAKEMARLADALALLYEATADEPRQEETTDAAEGPVAEARKRKADRAKTQGLGRLSVHRDDFGNGAA